MIGISTIPIGIGSFLASPFGGLLSDAAARRTPDPPSARMLPGVLSTLVVFPVFLIVYGWMLQVQRAERRPGRAFGPRRQAFVLVNGDERQRVAGQGVGVWLGGMGGGVRLRGMTVCALMPERSA